MAAPNPQPEYGATLISPRGNVTTGQGSQTTVAAWSNSTSNPPTQNLPSQNVTSTSSRAIQPQRKRMLPAWIPSSNAEPQPRIKRIQVTKKQANYTSFSQVIDRVVMTTLKNEYKYDPLTEKDEIRLLVINPANKLSDPLYCQLVSSINQKEPPCPYEALSYMWGTELATEPIYIFYPELRGVLAKEGTKNKRSFQMKKLWARFYVRPNLHFALQRLRNYDGRHIYLWVDAICIDQNNNPERSIQVTKMAEIYNRASNVCVWLGSGNMQSKLAFDFMKELLKGNNLDHYVKDPSSIAHWTALASLMKNQWFSRRWVVQEVALAQNATLHCGGEIIYFDEFADTVHSFIHNFDEISKLLVTSTPTRGTSPLGNVKTGAWVLCKALADYFPKGSDGTIDRKASLETLVSQLISFDASEPRDIIYAVLSLAKDIAEEDPLNEGSIIVPDYDDSIIDVFRDFIDFSIKQSESLDIICRCWAPVVKIQGTSQADKGRNRQPLRLQPTKTRMKFPSWMPSVSNAAYGTPVDHLVGRMNGDSFVGPPEHKLYNATPRTSPVWRFGVKVEHNKQAHGSENSPPPPLRIPVNPSLFRIVCNGAMFVKGFVLDVIEEVGFPITEGIISREALSLGGWFPAEDYYPQDAVEVPKVPDELWRTMVANKGPTGEAPPPTYQRACQKCLAEAVRGDINITKLIQADGDQMMVAFLKRVEAVVWNRVFVRSKALQYSKRGTYKAKNLFGLGPRHTRDGDLICILLGCSVPVILRAMPSTKTKKYELMGEAYIYGMMNGDALGGRRQDQLVEECDEFELQ